MIIVDKASFNNNSTYDLVILLVYVKRKIYSDADLSKRK